MRREVIRVLARHSGRGPALWLRPNPMHLYIVALLCAVGLASAATNADAYSVRDFGARADGTTDDTAAFQKALDAAGQAGGGVVYAPRGNYFFAGHLSVPNSVTLKGVWESVPSHVGMRNADSAKPTDDGTTFLVTESRGKEIGRAH